MNPLSAIALAMVSFVVAAASPPAKSPSPQPAKSQPPLSKYAAAHQERMKISAPADEYFGKLKLSFLGIDNELRDAAITAGEHTTDPAVINKVAFAEDALKDWEKKYPRDPQLARSYYLAIALEKKIWVQANQQQAWAYMNRIAEVFPTTYFGKLVKREIANGFTEHYYAAAVPCPSASPTPSPTPTAVPAATATVTVAPRGRQPKATPSPRPTPTPAPTASPTPEPTPSPSPAPTQLSKGLKVQILTPPCVAPPTPAPVPTGTPAAATPVPAATVVPAATAVPAASSPRPSTSPSPKVSPKP